MKRSLSDHEEEDDSDELPSCGYTLIENFITPSHMLSSDIKRMQPQDMEDKDRVLHCVRTNIDPESSYGLLVGKCVAWSWEHRPMFFMTTPCILYSKAHCEEYEWPREMALRQLCIVALKEGTFIFRGKQRFDMNVGDLFVCDSNVPVTLPEMTTNHYLLVFCLNERK